MKVTTSAALCAVIAFVSLACGDDTTTYPPSSASSSFLPPPADTACTTIDGDDKCPDAGPKDGSGGGGGFKNENGGGGGARDQPECAAADDCGAESACVWYYCALGTCRTYGKTDGCLLDGVCLNGAVCHSTKDIDLSPECYETFTTCQNQQCVRVFTFTHACTRPDGATGQCVEGHCE